MIKTVYMIGNAHLDPVWMWRWQEGYAEAKATFRSALDRMNEYPDYKFTCAAAVVYSWVEETCPDMFEEIKARVAEGRWVIAGGWWVQPDCNQPSGESFARHALYSQRYFMEKFGVTAKVGYNVDSFGHNQSIPQFLKKSGMDNYVMMRPGEHEMHLESNLFEWKSPDGSTVNVFRIINGYASNFESKEDFSRNIDQICNMSEQSFDSTMVFYGIGNHGGGPTKKNLSFIEEMKTEYREKGIEILYGSPDDFFKKLESDKNNVQLYKLNNDLQHHASGCYSAVSKIKTANRNCENRLIETEKYAVLSNVYTKMIYPADKIENAWRNTLFNQFHDSLGGCSIKPVYSDALEFAGETLSVSAKIKNNALQRLSWNIDTSGEGFIPVVVFNPLSWNVCSDIRINGEFNHVTNWDDKNIPSQLIRSETQSCYGRCDTLINVSVPAFGWTVYKCARNNKNEYANEFYTDSETIENSKIKIKFEKHSGYIKQITDKTNQKDLLKSFGAIPAVIDEFYHDTWSHAKNYFTNKIAQFNDAEITVIETGPVRACIKIVNRYNNSVLTQYFMLSAGSDIVEVKCVIDWHEKNKMLKLEYPVNILNPHAYYEIPYAFIERPCDGEEECGLRWIAVRDDSGEGLAIINDNKYSFSIKDSTLNLTVVRSPIYGDHGNTRSDESPYTDQGEHEFSYKLMPLKENNKFSDIIKLSEEFNTPPTYIIENCHSGSLPQFSCNAYCSADNVILSVIKKAEDDNGIILRLYETDGKMTECTISLPLISLSIDTKFTPHEIKTLRITDNLCYETLLTEM